MKSATTEVTIRIADSLAFKAFLNRTADFINEYAWHARYCAAIDADGEWRKGNPACTCGFDDALSELAKGGDALDSQSVAPAGTPQEEAER